MSQVKAHSRKPPALPRKTIRVPVGQALNALNMLRAINAKMPAQDAYRVHRLAAYLGANPDVQACETTRVGLATRYGATATSGIPAERIAAFSAEYQPVCIAEIELAADKVPLQLFASAGALFSPQEIATLEPWLEMEETK